MSPPPIGRKKPNPSRYGREKDKKLSRQVNGRPQPGSGNVNVRALKGDVVTEDLLYESKYTGNKQYPLKRAELATIEKHALAMDKVPVFLIEYEDGAEFVVLRRQDFHAYHEAATRDT